MTAGEAILDAVRDGNTGKVAMLLDQEPGLVNARNELGQSPILLAKYHRRDELVNLLLGRGAVLNIWEASAVGDLDRVMELLDTDDTLADAHSADGFTVLGLSAYFGHEQIVHNLLAKGANPNRAASNPLQATPLHSAVAAGHMSIVRLLVEAGAGVNLTQQQGFTPLHGAAANGDELMVRYLLANGATANARAASGQTPLDLALASGHPAVAALLRNSQVP